MESSETTIPLEDNEDRKPDTRPDESPQSDKKKDTTSQGDQNGEGEVAIEFTEQETDKWVYVIMFGNTEPPKDKQGQELPKDSEKMVKWFEIQATRLELEKVLLEESKRTGLIVEKRKSKDGKKMFFLITATAERLEAEAQRVNLKMKLKPMYGGFYQEFEVQKKALFVPEDDIYFFNKIHRIALVYSILQAPPDEGGAGIPLKKMMIKGVITKFYPLHDRYRKALRLSWANLKKIFSYQPIHDIRNYFGESVALYFAFLGFYTQSLGWASLVGFVATIFWVVGKWVLYAGSWASSAYSVFLCLWATGFLEFWKRRNNELVYEWGMAGYEEEEAERPEFVGEEQDGLYYKSEWIPWEVSLPDEKGGSEGSEFESLAVNTIKVPKTKHYSDTLRGGKIAAGLPLITTMVGAVIVITISVLSFRLWLQTGKRFGENETIGGFLGGIIGAVANAVTIIIMNTVWTKVAIVLTNWENHRTQTSYDDQLIFKIFVFQFINSYTSLYYIAFFKQGNRFWNSPELEDTCSGLEIQGQINALGRGCVDELTVQLVTILLVNIVVGQSREVIIPAVMAWVKRLFAIRAQSEEDKLRKLPQYEKDSFFSDFPGTFDEYSEMIIQFGFMTLFAAAFPLAPLLAAVNNMIEIRTDAFKMLNAYNRPHYRGAEDIGTWYWILEFMGIAAVITNCLLIGFSYAPLDSVFSNEEGTSETLARVLAAIVILEHILILTKYLMSKFIPDKPARIRVLEAKEKYQQHEIAKRLASQMLSKWSSSSNPKAISDD